MSISKQERIERLERAVETMAWWLVEAQTGFKAGDAQAIADILKHGAYKVDGFYKL